MNLMQNPPQYWNTPPSPHRSTATNVVIGCGVLAAIVLLCCAGGGLLLWRGGGSDLIACSDFTMKGEYKKAIPPCRSVVAKIPQSGEGHNNLGWCLTLDGQLPEGLVESRKAVELQPNRSTCDTLAMALAVSGQGKEALQRRPKNWPESSKLSTPHPRSNKNVRNTSSPVSLRQQRGRKRLC